MRNLINTYGPISDLERHLPTNWWETLFNAIYLKTDGDVVENEANTISEINLVESVLNLHKDDQILDLCCGQGRHSIELAKRGYKNIQGIDQSSYLIGVAKERALNLNFNINFSEGDARSFNVANDSKNCVILMGNSFGYFEREEEDNSVLTRIYNVLKQDGTLFLDLANGEWIAKNFEKRSWEWIDNEYFVNRERALSSDSKRLISREVVTNCKIGVIADQFYAERLYSLEDIYRKLDEIGFTDIKQHFGVETKSTREQDLGMMAHRYFITARASKKLIKPLVSQNRKKVSVLLGDPSLPDKIKLDNKFNQEDFQTIENLKTALTTLASFEFEYIDKHESFFNYLSNNKPDYVLNFCDEGFNNKAELELHVPAMLELLGIPYSGSTPKCLAICYDKAKVRAVAKEFNIPVPSEYFLSDQEYSALLPNSFPVLVKPSLGDSSYGITKNAVANNATELCDYIDYLKSILPGEPILIQEFLSGREFSVTLIGNNQSLECLPILEVDYSGLSKDLPRILSYESKWLPNSEYWNKIKYQEAILGYKEKDNLIRNSKLLFNLLNCNDYVRFDFREDSNGEIKLLEVNPNPGWCWDGKMNMMAGFAGLSYSDLLKKILMASMQRYNIPI